MRARVKGPASCLPPIEKERGPRAAEWKAPIRASELTTWIVGAQSRAQHVGQGHADALVGHTLAEDGAKS